MRQRLLALAVMLTVIPTGLFARSQRSGADPATLTGFLAAYTGDTLWPILFYFLFRFLVPTAKVTSLLLAAIGLTLGIEFLQLWQLSVLEWLRDQPVIGFILGSTFIWSDIYCCVVGALIAGVIDLAFIRTNRSTEVT